MFNAIVKFAIAILISLFLVIEALYLYGLKALPENTTPSSLLYSKDLIYAQWVELGGSGDIKMQKMYPETFIITFLVDNKHSPQSSRLAFQSAKYLLRRNAEKTRHGHLNSIAVGLWVSQHWTVEEALNTVLDSNYYGKQLFGIRAAAKTYFKKKPNELTQDEILFLVALSKGTDYYDPACHSERLLRQMNYLKGLLSARYPQLYVDLKPINRLPLDAIRWETCHSEKHPPSHNES